MKAKTILLMLTCFLAGMGMNLLLTPDAAPGVEAGCTDDPCDNPPCCNGDTNGDGSIDLSDPILLLTYLFSQGTEPVPFQCQAEIISNPVLETGQTNCYNTAGQAIECDSADWPGQDGAYLTGCPMEGRFVNNGDGTVTDNCTGLMWQQTRAPGGYNWQEALKYCDSLELAEHSDWRLPSIRELHSILDYGRFDPAIDAAFDADTIEWYWTSTTYEGDATLAWDISFYHGAVNFVIKTYADDFVRAVRTITD